jgi:hypothetical protein
MTQRILPISGPLATATPVLVTSSSAADRGSLRACVAMLGLFGLGLGAFVLYTHSFMSVPAEIGLERSIDPPQPRSHQLLPPMAAGSSASVHGCAHPSTAD